MTEQHQIAIFEAMESPDFYPHTVTTIEQRENIASGPRAQAIARCADGQANGLGV